jgi:hypothetical protein
MRLVQHQLAVQNGGSVRGYPTSLRTVGDPDRGRRNAWLKNALEARS